MKWYIFKFGLLLIFLGNIQSLSATYPLIPENSGEEHDHPAKTRHERKQEKYTQGWNNLIPHYTKLQFYGGMGLVSAGFGWDYGRQKQWETDIFIGLLPRFSAQRASATFTLKQNYIPWRVPLGGRWTLEPLETGMYINKLTSRNFWGREPEKYGGSYYRFSTNMRISAFIGQRINLGLGNRSLNKSICAFYELSTNDLYLVSAFSNKQIKPHDILVLSFGFKFQFL